MRAVSAIRSRVGAKFVVAFALTLVLTFLVYVTFMQLTSYRAFRTVERQELASAVAGVRLSVERQATAQIDDAVDHAERLSVGRALERGDRAWLSANVTKKLVGHSDLETAEVFAADGALLASDGDPKDAVEWRAAAVQSALRGAPAWALLASDDDLQIVAAAAAPAPDGSARPAGVVVAVRTIDGALLHQFALFTDSALVAYAEGAPVAVSGTRAAGVAAAPPAGAVADGRIVERQGLSMRFVALYDGLGRSPATLGVAIDESALRTAQDKMGDVSLVGTFVILLCAVVVATLVARHVTRPVRRLALAAAAFQAGEPHQPLAMQRSDEFGALGDAFDDMAAEVARRMSALSATVEKLTRGISDITVIGETLTQSQDVHGQLRRLAATIADTTSSDFVAVRLLDGDRVTVAVLHGSTGSSSRDVKEAEERARVSREAVCVNAVQEDPPNADGQPSAQPDERLTALLSVPLVESGTVVGTQTVGARRPQVYGQHDRALVTIVASLVAVALQSSEAIARLEDNYLQTVTALATAMEAKDSYTADHADTLADLALAVGRQMGLGPEELTQVQYGAVLHDIGKIGVPEAILNKPGRLTDDEFAVIARHTLVGESILAKIDYLLPVARIVRAAHERWDGKGYPDGLLATQIPLAARIVFVCDAFHAMTSDRPYRAALPVADALRELRAAAGTQFDPAVVEAFIAAWPQMMQATGGAAGAPAERPQPDEG
jgi:HD-GYP domain-containing protein (c-di-GMP phosphodiesterase class II)/HAMP domain-containing protein